MYHRRCVNLGRNEVIRDWKCPKCREPNDEENMDFGNLNSHSGSSSTRREISRQTVARNVPTTSEFMNMIDNDETTEEGEEEYMVERIEKHRTRNGSVSYLVKWLDYNESTWEPEINLKNSYDTLEAYKEKNKLGKPVYKRPVTATVGAIKPHVESINQANWVKPTMVIGAIEKYRPRRFKNTIEVRLLDTSAENDANLSEEDVIYVVPFNNHAYVILDKKSENEAILVDGANIAIGDETLVNKMCGWIGRPIRVVEYKGQRGVDHCGSSAAAIAIELERIYHNQEQIPEVIRPTKDIRDQIIRIFHKEPSKAIETNRSIMDRRDRLECPNKCGYSAESWKRGGFFAHVRLCKRHKREDALDQNPTTQNGGV